MDAIKIIDGVIKIVLKIQTYRIQIALRGTSD